MKHFSKKLAVLTLVAVLLSMLMAGSVQAKQNAEISSWPLLCGKSEHGDYGIEPQSMAVDDDGNVYVVCDYLHLKKYTTDGKPLFSVNSSNGGGDAYCTTDSIKTDGRDPYISDVCEVGIAKLNQSTKAFKTIIPNSGNPFAVNKAGEIYELIHGQLFFYRADGTLVSKTPVKTSYRTVEVNSKQEVFFREHNSGKIAKMNGGEVISEFVLKAANGTEVRGNDMAFDLQDNLYATEGNQVYKFTDSGKLLDSWTLPSGVRGTSVSVDASGIIYVLDSQVAVYKIAPITTYTVEYYVGDSVENGYKLGAVELTANTSVGQITLKDEAGKGQLNYMRPANEYLDGVQQGTVPYVMTGHNDVIKVLYKHADN